ncbi:hypothetical protein UR09_00145 [Candidatus Nitromaritima sp. SCGC AAA799-A02]|nr:hypothetical protein UZ36_00140 [Candidatus Nitromaritima sp. SCGC AAA799-C22]KMP12734.1 hypothetical protein UR09_00145 [Candidatus Nitromaritima sp. SCGC AAA799-A02]
MAEPEPFYKNIFTSLIDGVLVVSKDLKVIKGNQSAEEMFQRSRDSFEGRHLSELFPDQPNVTEKTRRSISTGTAYHHVEAIGYRKSSDTYFPASMTLSPILNTTGPTDRAVILIQDTSLIKELQESSRQMEHLSTLGVLTAGMAHEIRNPLSGIRASAQLMLKDFEDNEQREYLEIVIAEVDRINRLVKRMMNLTQPAPGDFKPTNIHRVLEEILVLEKESLERKNGKFVQVYDPSLPPIEADEDGLKQVFLNLIKNAVEASPEEKPIHIVTQFSTNYALRKSQETPPTHHIVVEIIDLGLGMSDDVLKNLFTPFFTTKKRGTGLGMAISLKIIENHLGKIKVISEKNAGTVVQVFLPLGRK